jgi:ribose transport system ATP-binding protein
MSANLLELRGITKRFAGTLALQVVNLSLQCGQVLALVGENGAGKSTLMKILSGVHRPDAGTILLDGKEVHLRSPQDAQALGISIIYQEFSLVPHLPVVENLFLGRERRNRFGACAQAEMRREAQLVLNRLGANFDLNARIATLSVAEQQFVEIAKALLRQTRILIMDEPTATLTPSEVTRLFSVMRELVQQGISIIFISHHLDEVFAIADDIVCLRDGQCVGHRRAADCSHDEIIKLMVGRDLTQTFPPGRVRASSRVALDVQRLQRKPHLPSVSFQLHGGEILGVAGLVGSGRTKMVRALIGADRAHQREISLRGKTLRVRNPAESRAAGIGLAPEDRKQQGLVLGASVQDNILLANLRAVCHPFWRFIKRSSSATATDEQIKNLRIKATSRRQLTRDLSGGNQQKVVLAKWLHADCDVLILDEPTRGIDVGAKAEIYQLMRQLTERGVAIIMISSELPEIIGMSDRVMVMRGQQIAHVFAPDEPATEEKIIAYAAGGRRG